MNVPLIACFVWIVIGMITTTMAWLRMPDEIESAIGMEEEEMQPALRVFITVLFVLFWPLLLAEMLER
jgi:hypothetical protein